MADFNETVNNDSGLFYVSESLLINRVDTIKEFNRAIAGWMDEYFDPSSSLYKSKARLTTMLSCFRFKKVDDMDESIECSSPRKLFILYKKQHRSKELAGRCFVWDVMEEPYCGLQGQELQKRSYRVFSVGKGFGVPRFDGVDRAVLITDREVVVYGRAMIVAAEMDLEKVRFDVCFGDMCVSYFDTDTASFARSFGLKENFPKQYDEILGLQENFTEQYEEQVKVETKNKYEQAFKLIVAEIINDAKRNIDSCMNLLDTNACQLERASDAIKMALTDIDDQKCDLSDMQTKLDNTLLKLKQGIELSGISG